MTIPKTRLPISIIRAIIAYKINALPFDFEWPITKSDISSANTIDVLKQQYKTLHGLYLRAQRCLNNRIFVRDHAYTENTRKASYEFPIFKAREQVDISHSLMSLVCARILKLEARKKQKQLQSFSATTNTVLPPPSCDEPTIIKSNKKKRRQQRKKSASPDVLDTSSSLEDMAQLESMMELTKTEAEKRWNLVYDMIQSVVQRLITALQPYHEMKAVDLEDLILPIFRSMISSKTRTKTRKSTLIAFITTPSKELEHDFSPTTSSDLLLAGMTYDEFESYIAWYMDALGRVLIEDLKDRILRQSSGIYITRQEVQEFMLPKPLGIESSSVLYFNELATFICGLNPFEHAITGKSIREVIIRVLPVLQLLLVDFLHPPIIRPTNDDLQATLFRRRAMSNGFKMDQFIRFRTEFLQIVSKSMTTLPPTSFTKFTAWRELNALMNIQSDFWAWQMWLDQYHHHSKFRIIR